jgi:D-inositol-3-phosphate glycosyltransferase
MISFVWSSKYPFVAGSGGSEMYTAGQIRELQRRGIATRLITIGHGTNDGRDQYPDIPFTNLASKEELSELDDTLVFVTYPLNVPTKRQSYAILHCPPMSMGKDDPLFDFDGIEGKQLIAPSRFAAKLWGKRLGIRPPKIPTAYPFASQAFSKVERSKPKDKVRILFAGRLTPDKGIYTLLASLHMPEMLDMDYELSATTACSHAEEGQVVLKLLEAHPWVNIVPARQTPQEMAELMSDYDVVVMPSTSQFWQEAFGMVSVEAQHAGCRVVASNSGGLPETNCGNLILVDPDNPRALSMGIAKAVAKGAVSPASRTAASRKFTVSASVEELLTIIELTEKKHLLHKKGTLVRQQLDHAIGNVRHLGRGRVMTGKNTLTYRPLQPTSDPLPTKVN